MSSRDHSSLTSLAHINSAHQQTSFDFDLAASELASRALDKGLQPSELAAEVKKRAMLELYRRCNENASKLARQMNLHRNTVYRTLQEYGVVPRRQPQPSHRVDQYRGEKQA